MDIKDVTDQIDPEQWQQILKAAYFIQAKMDELGYDNYVIGPVCSSTFANHYYKQEKKEQEYGNN